MPQTQPDGRHITDQLSQSIREMVDFLLSNPSDKNYYNTLYDRIEKLSILVEIEGYVGYKHENPHKTLGEFLSKNNVSETVKRYYPIPVWNKVLIKPSSGKKVKGAVEWVFDQLGKVKPDIRL